VHKNHKVAKKEMIKQKSVGAQIRTQTGQDWEAGLGERVNSSTGRERSLSLERQRSGTMDSVGMDNRSGVGSILKMMEVYLLFRNLEVERYKRFNENARDAVTELSLRSVLTEVKSIIAH
jgi:hypothetical protein